MYGQRLAVILVVLMLGCSPSTAPNSTTPATPPSEETTTSTDASTGGEVRLVTAAEFSAEMEARKGKVVLLDLWASW